MTIETPSADPRGQSATGAAGAQALVPPFFAGAPGEASLPPQFAADFHDLGAQVGRRALPGRGLVILHRGGSANPVVFAMSTSYMLITLIVLLGALAVAVRLVSSRRRKTVRRPRWDGGVRRLLPEMTYTATGFAQPVRVVFEAILRPRIVDRRKNIAEHFRVSIHQKRKEVHLVDRLVLYPLEAAAQWIAAALARMHDGRINAYAAYALATLVIFLTIAAIA